MRRQALVAKNCICRAAQAKLSAAITIEDKALGRYSYGALQ